MLTTKELEKQIKNEIRSNLGDVSYSNLFFKKGTSRSEEGTYIFNKNNEYHILYTQKGEISLDVVTCEEREVLWYVLNNISISIALQYAMQNRETGKDFRRALFKKKREIFALFGTDFEKRITDEIEDILKRYPYIEVC